MQSHAYGVQIDAKKDLNEGVQIYVVSVWCK